MIPVEIVPGIGGGGLKRAVEGVNLSIIYLICCKNICKCHNAPPCSTTTIKKNTWSSLVPQKLSLLKFLKEV
jgi:hypothetical protein